MLLRRDESQLLVIDLQERLLAAMTASDRVVKRCTLLAELADEVGVPILASEQNPKRLGKTAPALAQRIGAERIMAKMHFSCTEDDAIAGRLQAQMRKGRSQVVLAGVEAHICVAQTALELHRRGLSVAVVSDAVSSRQIQSVTLGLDRMRSAGIDVVNVEMVLFEWLGRADTDEFKKFSPRIK